MQQLLWKKMWILRQLAGEVGAPVIRINGASRTETGTVLKKESLKWGFPKMVVPNNQGFSYTKNCHVVVFWGYHHLRKHLNQLEMLVCHVQFFQKQMSSLFEYILWMLIFGHWHDCLYSWSSCLFLAWLRFKGTALRNRKGKLGCYFLCSSLPGEMIQFDEIIFQMGGSTTN